MTGVLGVLLVLLQVSANSELGYRLTPPDGFEAFPEGRSPMNGVRVLSEVLLAVVVVAASDAHTALGREARDAEKELIALMREIDRAHETSDVATFERIWADDYVLTNYRGEVKDRAQSLREWKAGEHRYASYVSDDIRVRLYGEAAVVTARVTRVSQSDAANVGQFRHTRVFVRQRNRWRLAATQVTPILP